MSASTPTPFASLFASFKPNPITVPGAGSPDTSSRSTDPELGSPLTRKSPPALGRKIDSGAMTPGITPREEVRSLQQVVADLRKYPAHCKEIERASPSPDIADTRMAEYLEKLSQDRLGALLEAARGNDLHAAARIIYVAKSCQMAFSKEELRSARELPSPQNTKLLDYLDSQIEPSFPAPPSSPRGTDSHPMCALVISTIATESDKIGISKIQVVSGVETFEPGE